MWLQGSFEFFRILVDTVLFRTNGERIVLPQSLLNTELIGKKLAAGALLRIIVGVLMLEAQTMLGILDRPLELCCLDI